MHISPYRSLTPLQPCSCRPDSPGAFLAEPLSNCRMVTQHRFSCLVDRRRTAGTPHYIAFARGPTLKDRTSAGSPEITHRAKHTSAHVKSVVRQSAIANDTCAHSLPPNASLRTWPANGLIRRPNDDGGVYEHGARPSEIPSRRPSGPARQALQAARRRDHRERRSVRAAQRRQSADAAPGARRSRRDLFREQALTSEQHVALARIFGNPIRKNVYLPAVTGFPEIEVIAHGGDKTRSGGTDNWHVDVSWQHQPPKATVLHAQEIPEGGGGDTIWASSAAVYDLLDPDLARYFEKLTAVNTFIASPKKDALADLLERLRDSRRHGGKQRRSRARARARRRAEVSAHRGARHQDAS